MQFPPRAEGEGSGEAPGLEPGQVGVSRVGQGPREGLRAGLKTPYLWRSELQKALRSLLKG